jgi:acyl-CoA hydrolase
MSELYTKSLKMSVLMTPDKGNFAGNVHGGDLMKLLDQVAYTCAAKYCGMYCVTVSADQIFFKHPIRIGELVTFLSSVNFTGKTSMEVGIRVEAEDLRTGKEVHTNTCYFTMVAIDENSKPCLVPLLVPETDNEKRRYENGRKRKEQRLKMSELLD